MSSITTPKLANQTISNIRTRYIFQRVFLGKILAILLICIMKKSNLEIPCKRNRFGYWNPCKCLPNFVNVAALLQYNLYNCSKCWCLQNFVNVCKNPETKTITFTRKFHVYIFHLCRLVKSSIFFLKNLWKIHVPCTNIWNCLVWLRLFFWAHKTYVRWLRKYM